MTPRGTFTYRMDFIAPNGARDRSEDESFAGDIEALDRAYALCDGHDIELWCGERYVAYVTRGSKQLIPGQMERHTQTEHRKRP